MDLDFRRGGRGAYLRVVVEMGRGDEVLWANGFMVKDVNGSLDVAERRNRKSRVEGPV
jgi:hypothetical protein